MNKISFFCQIQRKIYKLSVVIIFIALTTLANAQWNGTNPLTTTSRVTIASNNTPIGNLFIDGAACGGIHALAIRQPVASCTLPSTMGHLMMVDRETSPGTYSSIFTITNDGYVGIGTNAPAQEFHVTKKSYFSDRVGIGIALPLSPLHVVGNTYLIGNVGIGTTNPVQALHISGGSIKVDDGDLVVTSSGAINFKVYSSGFVRAREIYVDLGTIPDYVFRSEYKMLSIPELEKFILQNQHLPGVKSEAEYQAQGNMSLTELSLKLLEKVEEQALYIIELNKKIEELQQNVKALQSEKQ